MLRFMFIFFGHIIIQNNLITILFTKKVTLSYLHNYFNNTLYIPLSILLPIYLFIFNYLFIICSRKIKLKWDRAIIIQIDPSMKLNVFIDISTMSMDILHVWYFISISGRVTKIFLGSSTTELVENSYE